MGKEKKQGMQEKEKIEYEDVKHLSIGGFIGIGLAFGVAAGFSAGNLFFGGVVRGILFCATAGVLGGLILGLINKRK